MLNDSHDIIPVLSVGPFQATPLGLIVIGVPTWEECEAYGLGWQVIIVATPWNVGDWLCLIEKLFPDRYTQAISITGHKIETLRNWRYVASRVPISLRNGRLSWTHHYVIAPLDPVEQKRWLAIAEEEHLDTRELRKALAPEKEPLQIEHSSEIVTILRAIRDMVALPYAQSSERDYDRIAVLAEKALKLLGEEA